VIAVGVGQSIFGDKRSRPLMIGSILGAIVAVGFLLVPSFLASVPSLKLFVSAFATFSPFGAIVGVWALLWIRVGKSLHCPACDYEYSCAEDASIDHAERCPECGCEWKGRWVRGRRDVPWTPTLVLVACAAIGLVFVARNVAISTRFGLERAPVWLIERSIRSGGLARYDLDSLWSALRERTLDPQTESRLADYAVFSLREDNHPTAASDWLSDLFRNGRMSTALLNRYLFERVEATAQIQSTAGGRNLVVRAIDHDFIGLGSVAVVLDRCWLEPGDLEFARQDHWYGASDGKRPSERPVEIVVLRGRRAPGRESLSLPMPADAKGTVSIKLWVFWTPGPAPFSSVAPRSLAADPSLDPSLQLVRTIEITAELQSDDPKAAP
jgi:hypothetical protein